MNKNLYNKNTIVHTAFNNSL